MTLLEQLDAAERALAEAERRPSYPTMQHPRLEDYDHARRAHTAAVMAASARCMAAAARCLVTTEDITDGPVPPPERSHVPDFLRRNTTHPVAGATLNPADIPTCTCGRGADQDGHIPPCKWAAP